MTVPVPSSFETLSSYSVSRSSGKKRPRHMEGGGHQSDPSLVTWRNSSNSGIDGGGSGAIRNPRTCFPLRNDFIRSAWIQRARTMRAQEYEDLFPRFSASGSYCETNQRGGTAEPLPSQGAQKGSGHIGIMDATRRAEFCRAFRRLQPESMFRAPHIDNEPIWAYWGIERAKHIAEKPRSAKEGFVLVPAGQIREIRALEGALRHERDVLKAHCLLSLNEGEVSAHRPLEVIRMAVHDACDREMAAVIREYRLWAVHYNENTGVRHDSDPQSGSCSVRTELAGISRLRAFNVPKGFGDKRRAAASRKRIEELRRMPPSWRTVRWRITFRQAELKNQLAEVHAMFREEMQQRFTERYLEAWERRQDYDLYCTLAGQFWPLDAESFRQVNRPGKKLFLEIEAPARKISSMWRKWWPLRKALWRAFRVRQRWQPIVRLRLRHGRRACIVPCFSSWRRMAHACRQARQHFYGMQEKWVERSFSAWVAWIADKLEDKDRKLKRAAWTLKNVAAYRAFRSWQIYTTACNRARALFGRVVGRPTLHAWIRYTVEARESRRQGQPATTIQRYVRGFRSRLRYHATQVLVANVRRFVIGRRDRKFFCRALVDAHEHAAEELYRTGWDAEIAEGVSKEQRRIARLDEEIQRAERFIRRTVTAGWKKGWLFTTRGDGLRELKQEIRKVRQEWRLVENTGVHVGIPSTHLRTNSGGCSTMVDDDAMGTVGKERSEAVVSPSVSIGCELSTKIRADAAKYAAAVESEAQKRILSQRLSFARDVTTHNFDAKDPPHLKCCAPGCSRTFTHDEHYLAHWSAEALHSSRLSDEELLDDSVTGAAIATEAFNFRDTPKVVRAAGERVVLPETGHPTLGGSEIAYFHMLLAGAECRGAAYDAGSSSKSGFDRVSAYICREWGLGKAYNTLMFWRAVNSWRCHKTTDRGYLHDAHGLRAMYLDPRAPRAPCLPAEAREGLCALLDKIPFHGDNDDILVRKPAKEAGVANEEGCDGDIVSGGEKSFRDNPITCVVEKSDRLATDTRGDAAVFIQTDAVKIEDRDEEAKDKATAPAGVETALGAAKDLHPTSFDEAQWQALVHLCRAIGPSFWASDSGRAYENLRRRAVLKAREAAHEAVRLDRTARLAKEVIEVKRHLKRRRDRELSDLVEPTVEATFDVVAKGIIRGAAVAAAQVAVQELENAREADMITEAATVEAIWAIEPELLEATLIGEIDAFCAERSEQVSMALEDDWTPLSARARDAEITHEEQDHSPVALAVAVICSDMPGGYARSASSAVTIQCAWRQRAARVEARRRLAKVFIKRPSSGGGVYYEDTVTGISTWDRPYLAGRLFPGSTW